MQGFVYLCDACASWQQPKPDLYEMMKQILHGFKNAMPADTWTSYFGSFPAQLAQRLQQNFGL